MRSRHLLTLCLQLLATLLLWTSVPAVRADEEFLDPEVAFKLAARAADERSVEVIYTIAPGYYLYRDQFKFVAKGATLGAPAFPAGKTKFDETFQKTVETYRDEVRISIPVQQAGAAFQLVATNQGCADRGLCYPPQPRSMEVRLGAFGGDGSVRVLKDGETADISSTPSAGVNASVSRSAIPDSSVPSGIRSSSVPNSSSAPNASLDSNSSGSVATPGAALANAAPAYSADDAGVDGALRSGKLWTVVGVFFVAGVLLSLTPCVLPMLPILSSIIVGHGAQVSRRRGFALAASYSLGMALVYTVLGVAAGLAGEGLAAALQKPWVLTLFALALVGLSLSMFGVYELQLPSAVTGRLSTASQRLPAGRFAGVFVMGGLSALIVSPCVAAPLAGALVYLSQTRDVWLGGTALFSLAAGMSVPLLLMGASAGALLPRAGGWMDDVKRFFGVLLLGVALWTVQSTLPSSLVLAAWGALALSAAVLLASQRHGQATGWTGSLWRRSVAAVLAVCGLLQLVGAASGGSDPLQPLARWVAHGASADLAAAQGPAFRTVHSVAELDAALRAAGRPAMLDFYADWCVSCKEMERYTFIDPEVRKKMEGALLLKADVTANNADDRELLRRFRLFGPPGTIFFDSNGNEVAGARIAGFQNSDRFLQTLQTAGL